LRSRFPFLKAVAQWQIHGSTQYYCLRFGKFGVDDGRDVGEAHRLEIGDRDRGAMERTAEETPSMADDQSMQFAPRVRQTFSRLRSTLTGLSRTALERMQLSTDALRSAAHATQRRASMWALSGNRFGKRWPWRRLARSLSAVQRPHGEVFSDGQQAEPHG